MTELKALWDRFIEMFSSVEFSPINDTVDILLVTVIIYFAFKFLRDRRASKLAAGVILFLVFLVISDMFEMRALNFLLKSVTQAGLVALLIIFQPELRSALEKMGTGSIKNIKSMFSSTTDMKKYMDGITEVCKAAERLAATKTGAIIIFERETKIGDIAKNGTVIDAEINSMMIGNIFFNKAPLHDGALIVRENRLYAAGCFLPLTQNPDIMKELGTRHRAAIGISEVSDAVVVVVSEETGVISVAIDGKLKRGYSAASLEKLLIECLLSEDKNQKQNKKEDKDETNQE